MEPTGRIERLLQDPRIWQAGQAPTAACALVATGWLAVDRVLGGGWPLGQLTELFIDLDGMGELSLLLPALGRLMRTEAAGGIPAGWGAFIAPPYVPYAPALLSAGIDLSRLLVVHARQDVDGLWAMEQALHSQTCCAVIGWSAVSHGAALRRLQLATERSASWTVLFRPSRLRLTTSPAPLRIHLSWQQQGARLVVHVLKRRGGLPAMACVDIGR